MSLSCRAALLLVALTLLLTLSPKMYGDEGMWLFTNPPKDYLKKTYGFDADQKWLDHVQKSSVRFNSGGSGSFVSPDGLVITNHHVGLDALQKLSNLRKKDYVTDGFHAKGRDQEFKCEGMELNVLMKIEDVSERVHKAVAPDLPPDKAALARRA